MLASMYVMAGEGSQLSVAVAVPVFPGKDDASQLIVILIGHVMTGLVISCTVMTCVHSLKLPVTSVALHVLVMT